VTASCPFRTGRLAPPPPTLGALIERLSETGAYFDTDNLISNESSYLQVGGRLEAAAPEGGVYLGVGPDQNFSYIARLRPSWAFVVDIRRQNMLQLLLLASFLERAEDARGYLCLLLSRPCPERRGQASLPELLDEIDRGSPSRAQLERNLEQAIAYIGQRVGLRLRDDDRAALRGILDGFFEGQLELRFRTYGRPAMPYHPTLRSLLLARGPDGRGSFLASAADYSFVRQLARSGRLVPVVGDFAGSHALREIARFLGERGESVSAFYVSNVEFYLLRAGSFDRFVENVRALPRSRRSLFIRACFDYGREHPERLPGFRSATVLQQMDRFLTEHDGRPYVSDWDLCTRDYIRSLD
jgi:hypothetical protein